MVPRLTPCILLLLVGMQMVERILEKKIVDFNLVNRKGFTALDLIPENDSNADALSIRLLLLKAGATRSLSSESIQGNSASENSHISNIQHGPKIQNQEEVFLIFSDEDRGKVCLSVTVAAALLIIVFFMGSFTNPGSINQHGVTARFLLKILSRVNDLVLLASVSIVMGLTAVIFFKPRLTTERLAKIYSYAYVAASFNVFAYAASQFVIFLPAIGYHKWFMLPICLVSPTLLFLLFWSLKQGGNINAADQGTETSTISITPGIDPTQESKKTI